MVPMEKAGVAIKAFFSRDPMTPGEIKKSD